MTYKEIYISIIFKIYTFNLGFSLSQKRENPHLSDFIYLEKIISNQNPLHHATKLPAIPSLLS